MIILYLLTVAPALGTSVDDTGERGGLFDENLGSNDRHFMCFQAGDNDGTCLEVDPSDASASVSSGSSLGSARDLSPRWEAPAPALVGSSTLALSPHSTAPPSIVPQTNLSIVG
jgi:hypothetical protein